MDPIKISAHNSVDLYCKENIDLSVIIPVFNVEAFLPACIDSLFRQSDLRLEIILINDGSTDRSGEIADQYAERDSRVKVMHQKNGGASVARNAGLEFAQGAYIAFLDSDDWVKENSLVELYHEATKYRADVVKGNLLYYYHENNITNGPFNKAPKKIQYMPFSGKDCFIELVNARAYPPMACNYIYRKMYLEEINARFEEGIMAEDELWTPIVLCQAERAVIVDVDFYYYRQRGDSVMHTTHIRRRLESLFRVADRLFEFADLYNFSGDNAALKNGLYVVVFRIYAMAFKAVSLLKDSSVILPEHQLDRFWRDCLEMMPEPQKRCRDLYRNAATFLKQYTDWRTSDWVASIDYQMKIGQKLMLVYNTIQGEELTLQIEDVPADWTITTDRKYFQQAEAVVFYLPGLVQELENDLDKPEDQFWVSWYLESEKDYPAINDPEMRDVFDFWICRPKNEEQEEHPLVRLCREIDEKITCKKN